MHSQPTPVTHIVIFPSPPNASMSNLLPLSHINDSMSDLLQLSHANDSHERSQGPAGHPGWGQSGAMRWTAGPERKVSGRKRSSQICMRSCLGLNTPVPSSFSPTEQQREACAGSPPAKAAQEATHLGDRKRGRPLVLEDVQADGSLAVDVGVINLFHRMGQAMIKHMISLDIHGGLHGDLHPRNAIAQPIYCHVPLNLTLVVKATLGGLNG